MRLGKYLTLFTCLAISITTIPALATVKLYTIDCGRVYVKDFGDFSNTGFFDGKPVEAAAPCFLIEHPKGRLLWDAGVGKNETIAGLKLVINPVTPELRKIGLTPKDIDFLAFSHLHIDHIGQANIFTDSTWIMNPDEWSNMKDNLGEKSLVSYYPKAQKKLIHRDFDVFDDGSVKILLLPGHTSSHQALMVKLENSGYVLLAGDTYHQRESRTEKLVPRFNVDRADTLASMDRVEGLVKLKKAKLIIQHDIRDFKSLPKFREYMD
ncbi:N-acyl homoserine lactonase family protein [Microbulbifer epialgicus]|uniref:N-acyl homoserine lactonase family protein n=1 Tax=Microbulbifer epialgicus TaxID=393907 RepID=A0ABV4NZB0_9GAMM